MSFKPLFSLLNNKPIQQVLTAAHIVYTAQQVLGDRGKVLSCRNGTLKLNVATSVAAAELKVNEEELIRQLNARIGKEVITKIRFKIGE